MGSKMHAYLGMVVILLFTSVLFKDYISSLKIHMHVCLHIYIHMHLYNKVPQHFIISWALLGVTLITASVTFPTFVCPFFVFLFYSGRVWGARHPVVLGLTSGAQRSGVIKEWNLNFCILCTLILQQFYIWNDPIILKLRACWKIQVLHKLEHRRQ